MLRLVWQVDIFLDVLGFKLRASHLLGTLHLSHSASHFMLDIFEIGSHKLFAGADFEP
jgi:hypothetical protein